MDKFLKHFQLVKVDIPNQIVYGLVTAERKDKDGETCHYASTAEEYKAFSDEMSKASDGENIMPLREMHQLNAVGKGKSIDFDDAKKEIRMGFKVVDSSTWNKVIEKVLLGFSQGGRYVKKWTEGNVNYYTSRPGEVSLVDNPCLSGAVIEYLKADGSVEEFITPSPLARLSVEDVDRLAKSVADSLSTRFEEITSRAAELVRKDIPLKGDAMTPEQIKKCAESLGMTEADFVKMLEASDLEKAKRGMAALHDHIKKAHGAATDHVDHLEKCMKACKDVMGSDSEKAVKALIDELAPKADVKKDDEKVDDKPAEEFIKKVDVEAMVKAAIEEFKKSLPAKDDADGVRIVPRDGAVTKASVNARNPMAVD